MNSDNSLLEQGIALARAGQRAEAYTMLRRALFAEGDDAALRVWLGSMAPTPAEAQTHLERALALDPGNAQAQSGLAWLEQQRAAAPSVSPPGEVTPVVSVAGPDAAASTDLPGWAALANAPAVGLTCPQCGQVAGAADRFCLRCGTTLGTGAGGFSPPHLSPAPSAAATSGVRRLDASAPAREAMVPWTPDAPLLRDNERALTATGAPPHTLAATPGTIIDVQAHPSAPRPAARRGGAGRALLVGVAGLLVLGLAGAFALLGGGNGTNGPEATAAAIAGATEVAIATTTRGAQAQATGAAQATVRAVPTTTAEASVNSYLQQVALLMRQMHNADADIQHTMQLVNDSTIKYDQATELFYNYTDASTALRKQAQDMFVPNEQHSQHSAMMSALTARDQAITGATQALQNLGAWAIANARAAEAQREWQAAYNTCQRDKASSACHQVIPWGDEYNTASSQAERAHTYAQQGLDLFKREWDHYKQLLPDTTPSGGDQ